MEQWQENEYCRWRIGRFVSTDNYVERIEETASIIWKIVYTYG